MRVEIRAAQPGDGTGLAQVWLENARYYCVVEVVPQLYTASEQELLELLQALPEPVSSVMLIGHNPGLHNLALLLASGGADLPQPEEKFPTGALATLVVHSESWTALGPGEAELVDYVLPRQLG